MDSEAGKGGNAGTNGKASVAGGVGIVRWSRKLTTATIAMARNPSVVGSSPTWGTDPLTRLPRRSLCFPEGVPLLSGKALRSCDNHKAMPQDAAFRRHCQRLWASALPAPMGNRLAISGDYRFSSRRARDHLRQSARHLRRLSLQFQAIPTLVVYGASPSLGTTASVPGMNGEGDFFALAISRGYRFKFTGYCFTLDGDTPKPPRGERNSSSIPSPLRESAHKGPGVLNHRANEPSMTICALLCPR